MLPGIVKNLCLLKLRRTQNKNNVNKVKVKITVEEK